MKGNIHSGGELSPFLLKQEEHLVSPFLIVPSEISNKRKTSLSLAVQ